MTPYDTNIMYEDSFLFSDKCISMKPRCYADCASVSRCALVNTIKRAILLDHLHPDKPRKPEEFKCPSPPCGGDSSGGAACLSGHTQLHYVHTWGLCEWMQQISCEGVKDL